MRLFKVIKCAMKGHILDTPSIINFIDKDNYLKKCSRCGLYEGRSAFGMVAIFTEKEALQLKQESEMLFPHMKKGESNAKDIT